MTRNEPERIEELLTQNPAPPPPDGLLERLRAEIPEPAANDPGTPGGHANRRLWLVAASLAVTVVGATAIYRVARDQAPPPAAFESTRSIPVEDRVGIETTGTLTGEELALEPSGRVSEAGEPAASGDARDEATADGRNDAARDQETRRERTANGPPATEQRSPTESATDEVTIRPSGGSDPRGRMLLDREVGQAGPRRPTTTPMGPGSRAPAPTPSGEAPEAESSGGEATRRLEEAFVEAEPRPAPAGPGATSSIVSEAPRLLERLQRVESPKPRSRKIPMPDPTPDGRGHGAPPSTGGTAEPNDQPYGDMFFKNHGVNPFVDTEDDRLSTFGLDVDTGSWGVARSYLERGYLPPADAVRVEELLNAFDYGDAPPEEGDFALHAQAGPAPFGENDRYRLVRFGLRAREVDPADRKPATLVFVVDISGSMSRENRLGLVKRSLMLLLDRLRPDDRVGLVVYGSEGRVLLEPTGDLEAIRDAIERLAAGGSTNAEEGLALAYDLLGRHLERGSIHRIILCSDGVANVGRTGPESILARIAAEAEAGIELTTVGFGMGNYNDHLMEQLADHGDGRYAYVDDLAEARRIFVEGLTGTLQTIAYDAKAQVEFDPRTVTRWRLLGYENRDVADDRFRDDTVDAGEIGAGHTVTALYEVKLAPDAPRRALLATLRLRYRPADGGPVVETERAVRVREIARTWEASPRELQLAAVVAELGELLRGSFWAKGGSYDEVFRRSQAVSARFPGDPRVAELAALAGRAAELAPRQ